MKKIFYVLLFTALPSLVAAQIEKSVEVTKDYAPSVAKASKLPVVPDMTDTVALRPDIDYSITPLAMETTLAASPIRPATVTYWEFNRPKPFYLKLGAGWPLNTVADFYATTQNPGTGYLTGYINHDGRFADIRNDFGVKANAVQMYNRAGIAAGKYLGKHILEGEFGYENRLLHRYGRVMAADQESPKVDYGQFDVLVRFGDDFTDLTRTNFNIALRGAMFSDLSDLEGNTARAKMTHLGLDFALARQFGRHEFKVQGMFEHGDGTRAASDYGQDIVTVGLHYGYEARKVSFGIGADYYYDKIAGVSGRNYIIPALKLQLNVGKGFAPFLEADGTLRDNSLRTLVRLNPYVLNGAWCDKSTVDYNFRLGAGGSAAGGRFAYRIHAAFSINENQLFWAVGGPDADDYRMQFIPLLAHQTVGSVHGELEFRPSSRFLLTAGVHGYTYNDSTPFGNGSPAFKAHVGARYYAKRVSLGVKATMLGARKWSLTDISAILGEAQPVGTYDVPFTVDVSADVDWQVSKRFSLFAELRNIANTKLYDYPYYPQYGINFTAGIKLMF